LIDLKNDYNATSLSNAIYRKQYRIVNILIEKGSKVGEMEIKAAVSSLPVNMNLLQVSYF
jgi:hypothetical protein